MFPNVAPGARATRCALPVRPPHVLLAAWQREVLPWTEDAARLIPDSRSLPPGRWSTRRLSSSLRRRVGEARREHWCTGAPETRPRCAPPHVSGQSSPHRAARPGLRGDGTRFGTAAPARAASVRPLIVVRVCSVAAVVDDPAPSHMNTPATNQPATTAGAPSVQARVCHPSHRPDRPRLLLLFQPIPGQPSRQGRPVHDTPEDRRLRRP